MHSIFHWDSINLSRSPCSDNVQGEMGLVLWKRSYSTGSIFHWDPINPTNSIDPMTL
ncbi:hypothetical protein KAX35_10020 [candidate division WOR-3 bacterium]|nr:hypothetical protein [candidate division WOR-3 bacterium]